MPWDWEKESNLQRVKIIRVKIIQRKNVDFLKDFDGTEESGQIYGESKLSGVKIKRSQLYFKRPTEPYFFIYRL